MPLARAAPVEPTKAADCEATRLTIAGYGRAGGVWQKLGSEVYDGEWRPFGVTGFCEYVPADGHDSLPQVGGLYDRVRAAVTARRNGVRVRVKGGVVYGNGPC